LNDGEDEDPLVPNTGDQGGDDDDIPAAVPEPGTFLLFGAGLLGILALRRKHRK